MLEEETASGPHDNGGQWNLHGTYTFPAGAQATVQVTDQNGQAAAAAVRFVLVP